ncbi:MAG: hypothetical protein J5765_04825, partial [Clostridia bacterium]|nr:hypothetical protein [Clostridia bacterium]
MKRMRNAFFKKTLFCLFAVVLLVTLLFAACSRKGKDVPVPTGLAIKNEVLTWNAVDGALSYDVKIDETVYSTQETRFPLPITDYEFHEITVRVNTHDGASEYASSLTYTRHATQTVLASLSTPEITMTSNRVMWGTVLNNNGYLIYMGNTVITVAKNATYYDLTFPADGIYYIRMQTLGDGVSYSNSNISNAYAVTVKDGKAPLRKLPKAEFSFDVSTKSLVWTNRYSAEAVDYEIYQEGISLPIETIPADATKVKMTYKPTLNGTKVTYKMRLISNNGLYSPSDFNQSITFPIADSAPTDLAVSLSKGTSAYEISWSAATYCDGYTVEIDGVTYDPTEALSMPIPSGLAEGRHIARVKTHGVGVHYADSIYSEGVVFYLDGKGEMPTPIQTPTAPTLLANEDGESYTVYLTPVEGAAKYRLIFVGASGENTLVAVNDQFELTAGRFDNRNATDAEKTVIGRILGDMETGLHLSVVAIPSDPHYLESAISREAFFSTDGELTATISPDLTFGADGFSWSDIGEETLYEIKLDGAIYDPAELPSLSEGTHRARVRVKKDGALWSNEIIFRAPIDLDAPTDLSLSNGVLSFNPSKNATGYKLFVDGILLQTVSPSDHRITLANYIKQDGEYVLHLVATAGNATLADSAPSRQILYVKNDAPSGTESKPYYLSTATDLWATMRADPTANFLLVGNAVYDFTGFDFSAASAFTFKGTLMGNGATVKGISVTSPLFSALEGATIRDVTFEIDAENFVFSQNGIFAATAKDTTLSGIAFSLSGRTASPETGSFGLLFHTVTGLALRDSSVVCDLTVGNGMKTVFGVIADSFEGTASGVTLSGRVSASGNDVTCGAFAVTGDMTLSELTSSLTLTLNATNQLSIGGISPNGVVKGSHITLKNVISANAAYAEYYGVASESVTMSSSDLGGTVSAQGSSVTIVGVSKTGALSLTDVKVTAALKGKASSELRVAGVADTIPSGAVTTGFSFEGEIDANAPKVTAAGIAFTCVGSFRAKSAGTIKVTGKEAKVSLGAVNAADMTIESAGSITLIKVDDAEVGGAALTSDGKTTLSGRLTVSATECGEVRFGGAIASGDQTVEIGSYEIDGQLAADSIRFGGVGYDAGMVNFSAASLGVNVTLTSEDVKAAGAYLSATSVSVANPSVLSSRIAGIGSGAISGVFGEVGSPLLKDITVS